MSALRLFALAAAAAAVASISAVEASLGAEKTYTRNDETISSDHHQDIADLRVRYNLSDSPYSNVATAYYTAGTWSVKMGVIDKTSTTAAAWAIYSDMDGTPSSFGQLSISTNPSFTGVTDALQMTAAGVVEGAVTAPRIAQHFNNTYAWVLSQFTNGIIPQNVTDFFTTQMAWTRSNIATNTSDFWVGVSLIMNQFDGLVAGYNLTGVLPMTEFDFLVMNGMGDILDLIPALKLRVGEEVTQEYNWENMSDDELMNRVHQTTHCSALVKVTGALEELYFSHSAWFIYQSTLRIFKNYKFALINPIAVGNEMSFSSYPAYLESLDDYYTIYSSGIVVLETTNSIFNMSLYELVKPQSLYAWQRVRTANLLASTGTEWAETFSTYNSGTYNNQYDVIMVSKFVSGAALPDGLLTIVEQIPGLVVYGDATQELERGYFPSYNVPYFAEIYEMSGYTETIASRRKGGVSGSGSESLGVLAGIDYQLAPRAKIFRRDAGAVENIDEFLSIMRYNDYKNDPYSGGSPWGAICGRGDLAGGPDGCLDTKAGSATMFAKKQSFAVNGPTTGSLPPGGNLPPYNWTQFPNTPHEGLPEVYDFMFEVMTPNYA